MISPADLAMMRDALGDAGVMQTACTITRGGTVLATTTCSIALQPPVTVIPADRLEPEPRWRLRFPFGTSVQRGDVVTAAGERYAVVEEDNPRTFAMTTLVIALKTGAATDDPATPGVDETNDYLHANAVIQLKRRSGTVVYASRPVRLDFTMNQETIDPFGERIDATLYDVPDADYKAGDIITVLSMSGHTVAEGVSVFSAKTPTLIADPDPLIRVGLVGSGR